MKDRISSPEVLGPDFYRNKLDELSKVESMIDDVRGYIPVKWTSQYDAKRREAQQERARLMAELNSGAKSLDIIMIAETVGKLTRAFLDLAHPCKECFEDT